MSSRIFIQDTTTLALLYNYEATRGMLLSLDKIRAFDNIVDNNLEKMNSGVNMVHPLDYSRLIYFTSCDENGNEYCILKPDFSEEQARIEYIYRTPYDVIRASQQENALEILHLKLENGKIVKKAKNINLGISNANSFMDIFLENLRSGKLKIETCPQVETGIELTEEIILKQLEKYQKLLDTDTLDEEMEEEQGPVKKLVTNKK